MCSECVTPEIAEKLELFLMTSVGKSVMDPTYFDYGIELGLTYADMAAYLNCHGEHWK
jgi:hypothetical protein